MNSNHLTTAFTNAFQRLISQIFETSNCVKQRPVKARAVAKKNEVDFSSFVKFRCLQANGRTAPLRKQKTLAMALNVSLILSSIVAKRTDPYAWIKVLVLFSLY